MSELKERIEEVKASMNWNDTQMANAAGVSRSAVSQWAGKGSKIIHTIGDVEVALNLERATGYSALWIAKGVGHKKMKDRLSAESWPFISIDDQKVRALDPDRERMQLEAAILLSAAQLGLDVKKDEGA